MDLPIFVLNFASGISMLLVIYAAYMMVRHSRGDSAAAFKIILIGHVPSALVHFLASLAYFGVPLIPDENSFFYAVLNHGGQVVSALSVFIAIYVMKRVLFDKIAKFANRLRGAGDE
ncbi:Uncharacterised protein [uncultured archaeon]|nr:Uncharacterised protein [uncultured archaeon]